MFRGSTVHCVSTGNPVKSFGLSAQDLQEDFDPAAYDETMQGVFGEEYYAGAGEGEEQPVFSDLEEELNGETHVHHNARTCITHVRTHVHAHLHMHRESASQAHTHTYTHTEGVIQMCLAPPEDCQAWMEDDGGDMDFNVSRLSSSRP